MSINGEIIFLQKKFCSIFKISLRLKHSTNMHTHTQSVEGLAQHVVI